MLLPVEVDLTPKKKSCKRNLVRPGGSNGSKVDFTLLAKVIALYVRLIAVDIQGFDLEFVFKKSTISSIKKRLNNLVQVLLAILVSTKVLENKTWGLRKSNKSFRRSKFIWL